MSNAKAREVEQWQKNQEAFWLDFYPTVPRSKKQTPAIKIEDI